MTSGVPAMVRSTSYESMVDKGKSRAGDSVTRSPQYISAFRSMLQKGSSKNTYSQIKTPEFIFPAPDSSDRRNEFVSAVFNMVATMMGGSVLSLPYAMRETGIFFGMLMLAVSVGGTYFSLDILCSCARRSGVTSYIEVARVAYGNRGSSLMTTLLLIFTVFVLVAYMVLSRDIWTGLFELSLGREISPTGSIFVLFSLLVVCFPACMAKDFHALRHMCYVSFSAAIILVLALGYSCVHYNIDNPDAMKTQAVIVSTDWGSILPAFPLFALSFMCHFSILSVHSELINPTRERIRGVIGTSMGIATIIYVLLGLFGYLYAYKLTSDDILLNFEPNDKVMLLGRFGFGLSMLVAIPILTLPTRNTVVSLYGEVRDLCASYGGGTKSENQPLNGVDVEKPVVQQQDVEYVERTPSVENIVSSFWENVSRTLLTVGILGFCFVVTQAVPGVSVVWSICGSSLGLFVAFFLPNLFYLKIRRKKNGMRRLCCKISILLCSIAMIFWLKYLVLVLYPIYD